MARKSKTVVQTEWWQQSDTGTLYCSFCGKSQHEVRKLVAGPTVFICDECIDLCDDIVWVESTDRFLVKIKTPKLSAVDDMFYDGIAKIIGETFPGHDFKYEFRNPSRDHDKNTHDLAVFSFESKSSTQKSDLSDELQRISAELAVVTQKFYSESKKCAALSETLSELRAEYLDVLRADIKERAKGIPDLRAVLFLDISGFSKFDTAERNSIVTLLRGLVEPLVSGRGGQNVNMWGDALVANFVEPKAALEIAAKFLRHLSVEQLDGRIGIAWGSIDFEYNPATGKRDIAGETVNFAARLEPLADLGSILVSKEFAGLEIPDSLGELRAKKVRLKKAVGKNLEGDEIDVFEFIPRRN